MRVEVDYSKKKTNVYLPKASSGENVLVINMGGGGEITLIPAEGEKIVNPVSLSEIERGEMFYLPFSDEVRIIMGVGIKKCWCPVLGKPFVKDKSEYLKWDTLVIKKT